MKAKIVVKGNEVVDSEYNACFEYWVKGDSEKTKTKVIQLTEYPKIIKEKLEISMQMKNMNIDWL